MNLFQEFQLSVQGIGGLPDNITLGLHRTKNSSSIVVGAKQTKSVKTEKNKKKQSRRVSVQSHNISEADVNIGYTGIDMKRELQISFGKLEAAESSVQVIFLLPGFYISILQHHLMTISFT